MRARPIVGDGLRHDDDASLCGLSLDWQEFRDTDEVIGDEVEEIAGDAADASMSGLAHRAVQFAPAEDALDHRAT